MKINSLLPAAAPALAAPHVAKANGERPEGINGYKLYPLFSHLFRHNLDLT